MSNEDVAVRCSVVSNKDGETRHDLLPLGSEDKKRLLHVLNRTNRHYGVSAKL